MQSFKSTTTSKIFDSQCILACDYFKLFKRIHNLILQHDEQNRLSSEDNSWQHQDYFVGALMLFDIALKSEPDLIYPNCVPRTYLACLNIFIKFYSDLQFDQKDLAWAYGMSLIDFNKMEVEMFMNVLKGKILVKDEKFTEYKRG